jgi:hypothetical protein
MRCLLDKNIVRHAITGLYQGRWRLLSPLEASALNFWRSAQINSVELFISPSSFHVLQPMQHYAEVRILLDSIKVLRPTRYHPRWARRVRETSGLSREDAAMIALATFGTNQVGPIFSVEHLISSDRPMINGYRVHFTLLERRLQKMCAQLRAPFDQAHLPELLLPDEMTFPSN